MSKIIVTGGAGFIGSNLVDALISSGHEVVVIDSLVSGRKSYINKSARFYRLDINSKKIARIFAKEQPEFVYHLAAQIEVAKSVLDPKHDNEVNILGALNILENCRKYEVKKIIFSSTGGAIYGEEAPIPTTEEAPAYPLSPYGINKLSFEKYLHYYYRVYGQDYTALRFANVYGPRQYKGGEAGVIAIFIANAVLGRTSFLYGDGRQTRDFVYVGDVVEALIAAKDQKFVGEINIGTGLEIDLWQVIEKMEISLGKKIVIEQKPGRLGEQRRSCLSHQRASEILNWQPRHNLAEGIKLTVDWAQRNLNNL